MWRLSQVSDPLTGISEGRRRRQRRQGDKEMPDVAQGGVNLRVPRAADASAFVGCLPTLFERQSHSLHPCIIHLGDTPETAKLNEGARFPAGCAENLSNRFLLRKEYPDIARAKGK